MNVVNFRGTFGSNYSRVDQVKFMEDKGCLPQILLGRFLITLAHYRGSLFFSIQVGILDVDLCGPSIPHMLNLKGKDIHQCSEG